MAWHLESNGEQFRFVSTITDGPISGWLDRKGAVLFIRDHAMTNSMVEVIREWMCFPSGWVDALTGKATYDAEREREWAMWHKEVLASDDYSRAAEDKYTKVMAEALGDCASSAEPKPLGAVTTTERGFELIRFNDIYDKAGRLQMSSLAFLDKPGTSSIWLGRDGAALHLDREQVAALIAHLQRWLADDTFELKGTTR